MRTRRRYFAATFLGHAALGLSILVALGSLLLWTRSYQGASAAYTLKGPGGSSFQMLSWRGRIMFGVFEPEPQRRYWWRQPPRYARLADMVLDEGLYVVGDLRGWGVALPHLLIAFLALVPAAWWIIVFRERAERRRRLTLGLCMQCGYDLRHAQDKCPECGSACGYAA